jgi:hypothetical protein
MKKGDLSFYRKASAMADAGAHMALFDALPDDVAGLAHVVPGVMLHQHLAPVYGETLTAARHAQAQLRGVEAMLEAAMAMDASPLARPRANAKRLVGVCRHFTLLMVAMLRAKGYAARSRCGFGTYFESGKFIDHWVAEYWHEDDQRWVMVDAQLEPFLCETFKIDFDPLDVPRDRFVVAGDAWAMVREGREDAGHFGIMNMQGDWFIAGNIVRDIAALNKIEMLPWDVWGVMPELNKPMADETCATFDRLAAPTRDPDTAVAVFAALYDEARVPDNVFNAVTGKIETL